jgi:hypothetical protein
MTQQYKLLKKIHIARSHSASPTFGGRNTLHRRVAEFSISESLLNTAFDWRARRAQLLTVRELRSSGWYAG